MSWSSKVPNTDQSNFPVLISGTYSYLATTGNGGKVTNSNGYDIIFTDSSGTNLSFERESYSAANGAVNFWVKVPTLSHTSNTTIYIYYGNSSVTTTDPQNKNGTWDGNFKGVWHLPNGTTLTAGDSTTDANTGTITSASAASGEIYGGASFNGSSSQISFGSGTGLNLSGAITMSAWVNVSAFPTGTSHSTIFDRGRTSGEEPYFLGQ